LSGFAETHPTSSNRNGGSVGTDIPSPS
jgi:hypothetical protein